MIGAINSNVMSVSANQYGKTTQIDRTSPAKKTDTKAVDSNIVSVDGDTLSISEEGAAYVEQQSAAATESVTQQALSDSTVAAVSGTATDTAIQAQVSVKTETESVEDYDTSDEDEDDTTNLSEYTESELKTMMYNGEITRSEYEEEIVSRNGAAALEED